MTQTKSAAEAIPAPLEQALEAHTEAALERLAADTPEQHFALERQLEKVKGAYALLHRAACDGDIDTAAVAQERVERLCGEIRTGSIALRRMAVAALAGGGR